ncbi:uncharacterized protein LOC119322439 [Triticum dicoccoides]|uniref:uncharacterized protein LOC119322439 n=1 Tax=Triticum dicoccoides TaxID=85692 RepID=UPI00189188EC|nr:uncharacterized protein LOC119322439 [Triticum dicoccoides]
MEFLLQPVNSRTLIEEVNDSDIPMEPLRYPVLSMPAGELPTASVSSAERSSARRLLWEQARVQTGHKHLSTHPGWRRRVTVRQPALIAGTCQNSLVSQEDVKIVTLKGIVRTTATNRLSLD